MGREVEGWGGRWKDGEGGGRMGREVKGRSSDVPKERRDIQFFGYWHLRLRYIDIFKFREQKSKWSAMQE
jgi:hypothetical protein